MASMSIIVPVLNEAPCIAAMLEALGDLRAAGVEIIVVDGGSTDATVELASPLADHVLIASPGRACQMNAGTTVARGDILLFLHADTFLPTGAVDLVNHALNAVHSWGRFDVRIEGRSAWLPVVATMMNWRSRLTGIATGDQAMFVSRAAIDAVGGFPDIPLMEDIALSRRLRKIGRPACLRAQVVTSGRRWEKNGFWKTIALMWRLRLRYFFAADARQLAVEYGYVSRESRIA
ncbi:MAG: TIGR04283 family arsenosugar biosynthesis glycosyltransferase [Rhizobium sp.]